MNPIYQFTIPVFIKSLTALDALLAKAKESGMDEAEILATRIAPDMFPFVKQVQITCDTAKGAAARLTGSELPAKEDNEATFVELRARIQWTIEYIKGKDEAEFADAADRRIEISYIPGKYQTGIDYTLMYVIPNFFFHLTTAYDILRMKGLQIGKADYIGGLNLRDI